MIRDYHLDSFWNDATHTFTNPPLNANFEANCIACHATGFTRFQDPMTTEWLTDAVDDVSGVYDIDHDGTPDEINIGCECCHGPGSDHVTWAADPANAGHQKRFIVNPGQLSPSRDAMICGRCHDRVTGNWSVMANEEPLNAAGQMAPVGISRQDWLASYTSVMGPAASDMWSDDFHSKNSPAVLGPDQVEDAPERPDPRRVRRLPWPARRCPLRASPPRQPRRFEQPALRHAAMPKEPAPAHGREDRLDDGRPLDSLRGIAT